METASVFVLKSTLVEKDLKKCLSNVVDDRALLTQHPTRSFGRNYPSDSYGKVLGLICRSPTLSKDLLGIHVALGASRNCLANFQITLPIIGHLRPKPSADLLVKGMDLRCFLTM